LLEDRLRRGGKKEQAKEDLQKGGDADGSFHQRQNKSRKTKYSTATSEKENGRYNEPRGMKKNPEARESMKQPSKEPLVPFGWERKEKKKGPSKTQTEELYSAATKKNGKGAQAKKGGVLGGKKVKNHQESLRKDHKRRKKGHGTSDMDRKQKKKNKERGREPALEEIVKTVWGGENTAQHKTKGKERRPFLMGD